MRALLVGWSPGERGLPCSSSVGSSALSGRGHPQAALRRGADPERRGGGRVRPSPLHRAGGDGKGPAADGSDGSGSAPPGRQLVPGSRRRRAAGLLVLQCCGGVGPGGSRGDPPHRLHGMGPYHCLPRRICIGLCHDRCRRADHQPVRHRWAVAADHRRGPPDGPGRDGGGPGSGKRRRRGPDVRRFGPAQRCDRGHPRVRQSGGGRRAADVVPRRDPGHPQEHFARRTRELPP